MSKAPWLLLLMMCGFACAVISKGWLFDKFKDPIDKKVKDKVKDHIEEVTLITKKISDDVKDKVKDHIEEVKPILGQTADNVKSQVDELKPILKDTIEKSKDGISSLIDKTKPIVQQAVQDAKDKVLTHIAKTAEGSQEKEDKEAESVKEEIKPPSLGLWFKKPVKKSTASFWSSSFTSWWSPKPKVDRLKSYLSKTFSVNSFDELCPSDVLKISSELKSMPNEWVSELPQKCYTTELLEMAESLNYMKKQTMMKNFKKLFTSMTSEDKVKVIAQDLTMFSSDYKLIKDLSKGEVFGICEQLNADNFPSCRWSKKIKSVFGKKLLSKLESCNVDDVLAVIKCASVQANAVAKCLNTMTCEQMAPIKDAKLPTRLSKIVTKACTQNLDGNKLKVMPCTAVKKLSFGNLNGLKFSDFWASFHKLIKCHSAKLLSTKTIKNTGVSTKVKKSKKKKETVAKMKKFASLTKKHRKKCPKLASKELVKKVEPSKLDKGAFFELLNSDLAGALRPKQIKAVSLDILCHPDDPSTAYSQLRNNARRAVKRKCKEIFDKGPLKDRGLTIIDMTKGELLRELEELGSEDDLIDAISEACAYSFQLPHRLLKVMAEKVKDIDLTIGTRLEDVACTLPKFKAADLKKFCDGNSDRLKLALGRPEVDFTKRPKKEGRLLGLCKDEKLVSTPCEQGDLVSEYSVAEVETLSNDIVKTEISCLDKVRSKGARKKLVEKVLIDPSNKDNECLTPDIAKSMGTLLDDVDKETLDKPCNKELLADIGVPYFKARADKNMLCRSLKEKGNVDKDDEEDCCNDHDNVIAITVLDAVSEKEAAESEDGGDDTDGAPEETSSRKKRSLRKFIDLFKLTCDQLLMLMGELSTLTAERIKSLSGEQFKICKEDLGNYEYFDDDVLSALADKSKKVFGDISSWTKDEALPAFVARLNLEEMSKLDFSDLELLETLGDSPYFEDLENSKHLLTSWKKDIGLTSTAAMTAEHVIALGNGLCSYKPDELKMLSYEALREAAEKLGTLDCFNFEALEVLYERVSTALGYDVLDTVAVSTLGNLMAGADWLTLDPSVVPAMDLDSKTLMAVPASKWKSVSTEQASAFTYQQAISLTDDVLQYLEKEARNIILNIAGKDIAVEGEPGQEDEPNDTDQDKAEKQPVEPEDIDQDKIEKTTVDKPNHPDDNDQDNGKLPIPPPDHPDDNDPDNGKVPIPPPDHQDNIDPDNGKLPISPPDHQDDTDPDNGKLPIPPPDHQDDIDPDNGKLPIPPPDHQDDIDPDNGKLPIPPPDHPDDNDQDNIDKPQDGEPNHLGDNDPDKNGKSPVDPPGNSNDKDEDTNGKPPGHLPGNSNDKDGDKNGKYPVDPPGNSNDKDEDTNGKPPGHLPGNSNDKDGDKNGKSPVDPPGNSNDKDEDKKGNPPVDPPGNSKDKDEDKKGNPPVDPPGNSNDKDEDKEQLTEQREPKQIIQDNVDKMREDLKKEPRHFSLPWVIRSMGKLAKEQLKKIDTELTSNFIAKISDSEVDSEVIRSLAVNAKSDTQKGVLQTKAGKKLPADKESAKGLLQWLSFRKIKKLSDDIIRELRPNLPEMDRRQALKTGKAITESVLKQFPKMTAGEKETKAVDLIQSELADSASRDDRKEILSNLGSLKLGRLSGLRLGQVKRMSSEFAKQYMKKLRSDNKMDCSRDDISMFTSKSPKPASLFLGAKCIADAPESAVLSVARGLVDSLEVVRDDDPESEKKAFMTPTARAIADRFTEKPDEMEKEDIKPLINSMFVELVPAGKLKKMNTDALCDKNFSYDYTLPAQKMLLFDKCKGSFGKIGGGNSASYGALLGMVPVEEITAMEVDVDDIWTVVETFCQQESELTVEQERAFYDKLENRLTKDGNKALKDADILQKSRCILKHIPERILKSLSSGDRETICENLADSILSKIKIEQVEKFKTLCLETKIPMSQMGEMLKTLTASDLSGESEQILDSVEQMNREIVSPESRKMVYDTVCIGDSAKIGATTMALCGKLVGEFADLEQLNQEDLLDMIEPIARQCEAARKKMKRCIASGQQKSDCRQHHMGCKRFIKHIFKTIVETTTTERRRRSTRNRRETCNPSLTCVDIKMAGSEAVLLEVDMLKSLCKSHFEDCAATLGGLSDFTTEQRDGLLQTAIKHWGEPSSWTSEQLDSAGVIVLSMTDSQLETIPIDSLEAASSIGQHWEWAYHPEKLRPVFYNWYQRNKANNVSYISTVDLQSLGHLVCGADTDIIEQIPHSVYADAAYQIGQVESCGVQQLRSWAKKATSAFGPVAQWSRSQVSNVGTIIGGLMKSEIQELTSSQIQAISYSAIDAIPAMCFAKFTAQQLSYLTPIQAIHATEDQLASLSETQRLALQNKANEIRSEAIVQDPHHDAGGAFVCASIWMIFTGVLAFFLQI